MILPRVIPCLLLKGQGLVKGIRFREHKYVGDPINAVRIFSEKEADELIFLDITATAEGRVTAREVVERIADEACMPFAIGGGIRTIEHIRALLAAGAEKVCINTAAAECPELVCRAAETFGSQSVVVAIDVRRSPLGTPCMFVRCGQKRVSGTPAEFAARMEELGAGEILVTSIDRDGTLTGYDLDLIRSVSDAVSIPVIACGGAGSIADFSQALREGHASAVAAGAMFVFHGPKRAVLIDFPEREVLRELYRSVGTQHGRD